MKVFGIIVIALGLVIAYIGITGSQHRIMDIIKGVHLPSQNQATASPPAKATTGGLNTQTGGSTA